MDWFSTGLIMGAVQGLTEFLPVSSSGHLVIAGDLIGFTGPKASTFEVAIQLGSIFAVLMVYWDRFMGLLLPGRVQTSAPKPFAGLRGDLAPFPDDAASVGAGAAPPFVHQAAFHPFQRVAFACRRRLADVFCGKLLCEAPAQVFQH